MTTLSWLLTLLCSLLGAGYVIAGKLLALNINPTSLTLLRIFLASICFLPFITLKTYKKLEKSDIKVLLLAGVFGIFLTNILYFKSLETITPLNASLINSLVPILMLITTNIFLKKMPSLVHVISCSIGFFGLLLMISKDDTFSLDSIFADRGNLIMLLSVFCWVLYSIAARYKSDTLSSESFTFGALIIGLIPLTPLGIHYGVVSLIQELTITEWLLVGYISIIATGLGYYLYTKSIEHIGPDKASFIVYNITPIFVMLLSFLIFDETISPRELWGTLCILCSLVIHIKAE